MDRVLTQNEVAKLYGLSVRTLERHRTAGTGPKFTRIGRLIRYREQDLADYVESNLHTSTSEGSSATERVART
jgi:predicted DNA-binding transcriptional regulator AlpA